MICIDNSFSRFSRKVVFFEILTDEEDDDYFDEMEDLEKDDTAFFEMQVQDIKVSVL